MACYNNNGQIYKFNKDSAGWYPRKLKKILNIMSRRVVIKLEGETLKPFIREEFKEKVKKIEKLYNKAKQVAN